MLNVWASHTVLSAADGRRFFSLFLGGWLFSGTFYQSRALSFLDSNGFRFVPSFTDIKGLAEYYQMIVTAGTTKTL